MSVWTAERRRALEELAAVFPDRRVVTIGAMALAHHLGATFRITLDLDLCIAIDVDEHSSPRALPRGWKRDPRLQHRWHRRAGDFVDVIPASGALLAAGHVTWPDGTRLHLTGIDMAMADASRIADDLPGTLHVASLRALFVCKVAAWLDRPGDRMQDLGDLALILDRYVDRDDPRVFDDPMLEPEREFDERPAFLLGVDLGPVCSQRHRATVAEFMALMSKVGRPEHAWLSAAGPDHWAHDESAAPRRLAALRAGLRLARANG